MTCSINHSFLTSEIFFLFAEELDKAKESKKIDAIQNYAELSTNIVLGNIVERKMDIKEFKPDITTKVQGSSPGGFPIPFTSPETVICTLRNNLVNNI